MPFAAQELTDEAAVLIGDPRMRTVTAPVWLTLFNRVQRKLAAQIDMLEQEAIFDITTSARYAWPDGAISIKSIRYGDDEDYDSYAFLEEMTDDEWRATVNGAYPTGTPQQYAPRRGWFYLCPKSDAVVTNGGLIMYSYSPVALGDLAGLTEFPDLLRDHFVDGLVIEGHRAMKEHEEANNLEAVWRANHQSYVDQLEDRAKDRKAHFGVTRTPWAAT